MKQPLIHQYNPKTNEYDVREMTDEEVAALEPTLEEETPTE